MKKITILAFVAYYVPGFKSGGPVRTISSIVETCGQDFLFKIITKDRDSGDSTPYAYVFVNDWNRVGNADVLYSSSQSLSFSGLYRRMENTDFDALYINSFFNPNFTLKPLLINSFFFRKPMILCPRGEFSPGAFAIKHLKKKLYIRLFQMLGLHKKVLWQATSADEAELIRGFFGSSVQVKVAQNISLPSFSCGDFSPKSSPLRVAFLSRISKKKNLIGALRSLAMVQADVCFDVYGPASREEDIAYREECQKLADKLPQNVTVRFRDEIHHDEVGDVLSRYNLFFLPTLGENFGHAILEALSAGLPILIGNTTPWRNLEELGVGWDIDPRDHLSFANVIEKVAMMSCEDHMAMRHKSLAYAKDYIASSKAVELTKDLFQSALR